MLPAIIHAPPRSICPPRKPPRLLRICTAARTGDAAGEPVANSRRSCWSRSRSPAAKAEPDPGYPRVANTMTRVPRCGERMRSSGPASADSRDWANPIASRAPSGAIVWSPLRSRRGHVSWQFLSRKALVRSRRCHGCRSAIATVPPVCWTSIPSKPDHVLRRHGRYRRPPATSITGLSLGQRERSSHRCRHTRCPNSSGGAAHAAAPRAPASRECETVGQSCSTHAIRAARHRVPLLLVGVGGRRAGRVAGVFAADRAVKSEQEAGRLGGDRCLACRSDALAQGPGRVRSGCPF